MTDTDWITDRLPTEADADFDGRVMVTTTTHGAALLVSWDSVRPSEQWRHTSAWHILTPTTTPRLFTSITHVCDRYLALADDGTAWFNFGKGWVQLDPLPAREVGQ